MLILLSLTGVFEWFPNGRHLGFREQPGSRSHCAIALSSFSISRHKMQSRSLLTKDIMQHKGGGGELLYFSWKTRYTFLIWIHDWINVTCVNTFHQIHVTQISRLPESPWAMKKKKQNHRKKSKKRKIRECRKKRRLTFISILISSLARKKWLEQTYFLCKTFSTEQLSAILRYKPLKTFQTMPVFVL